MSLVIALIIFECAVEINRIHLNASRISVAVIMRSALMFLFGLCALLLFGSGEALAVGAALGIMVGAAPLIPDLLQYRAGGCQGPVGTIHSIWLATDTVIWCQRFGAECRPVAARKISRSERGRPLRGCDGHIRQLFTMPSEAISGAYIAVAKRTLEEGREEEARAGEILRQAFRTYVAVAAFGCAYLLTFGDQFIGVLLGQHVPDHFDLLLPLLLGLASVRCFVHIILAR